MTTFLKDNALVWLLVAGTIFSYYWLLKNKKQLQIQCCMALLLAILHTLIGVFSVKVFAVMETLDFSNIDNMSLFGGVFFMPLAYWLGAKITKRNIAAVFDIFTPCMVFTVMCARVNCIISGCCLGRYILGREGFRFPTRELEILFYMVLLFYLLRKEQENNVPGLKYPVYMIA